MFSPDILINSYLQVSEHSSSISRSSVFHLQSIYSVTTEYGIKRDFSYLPSTIFKLNTFSEIWLKVYEQLSKLEGMTRQS